MSKRYIIWTKSKVGRLLRQASLSCDERFNSNEYGSKRTFRWFLWRKLYLLYLSWSCSYEESHFASFSRTVTIFLISFNSDMLHDRVPCWWTLFMDLLSVQLIPVFHPKSHSVWSANQEHKQFHVWKKRYRNTVFHLKQNQRALKNQEQWIMSAKWRPRRHLVREGWGETCHKADYSIYVTRPPDSNITINQIHRAINIHSSFPRTVTIFLI